SDSRLPISALAGKSVLAIAGIGNPVAFFSQLAEVGARVIPQEFSDHHAFGVDDVARILGRGEQFDYVVCTLKDAVKLGPLWPPGAPALWYVSLAVRFESGEAELEDLLMRPRGRIDVA
ncbi:MAG: tetraacyldisaccharide 4'-kinase, partial [Gemmatimonadales bacterium]